MTRLLRRAPPVLDALPRLLPVGLAASIGLLLGSSGHPTTTAPPVLDERFWRDFWISPAAAGVFALTGAVIAYLAATGSTLVARRAAERDAWWKRVECALDLLRSATSRERAAGQAMCDISKDAADETETRMLTAAVAAMAETAVRRHRRGRRPWDGSHDEVGSRVGWRPWSGR